MSRASKVERREPDTRRAAAKTSGSRPSTLDSRPFVLINMSMSADGKIATGNRVVSSFSSARDQAHLLELRATADAVMAGARTVDLNDINLGPGPARYRRRRVRDGLTEYNLRIVVSGSGSLNPQADIFRHRFSPIVVLTTARASKTRLNRLRAVADVIRVCGRREINWPATLRWLRTKWGVKRLLCEGGGELNDALFHAGLVDEIHLTICPNIIGGRRAPTIADGIGRPRLSQATRLQMKSLTRKGAEMFAVYDVVRTAGSA